MTGTTFQRYEKKYMLCFPAAAIVHDDNRETKQSPQFLCQPQQAFIGIEGGNNDHDIQTCPPSFPPGDYLCYVRIIKDKTEIALKK